MIGTDANTGKPLGGLDHLRQSVRDILTTPIGSRVMRRDYGSRLYQLVDAPINRATLVDIYAATAEALAKWEPRIRVTSVTLDQAQAGKVSVDIAGEYLPDGTTVQLTAVEVA